MQVGLRVCLLRGYSATELHIWRRRWMQCLFFIWRAGSIRDIERIRDAAEWGVWGAMTLGKLSIQTFKSQRSCIRININQCFGGGVWSLPNHAYFSQTP